MKQGALHRLAARHLERAEVQAAFDHVAFEHALAEVGAGMRAIRLGGVEGAVDIVDGHALVADLEALDAAGREIGGGADGDTGFCHGGRLDDVPCFWGLREKAQCGPGPSEF